MLHGFIISKYKSFQHCDHVVSIQQPLTPTPDVDSDKPMKESFADYNIEALLENEMGVSEFMKTNEDEKHSSLGSIGIISNWVSNFWVVVGFYFLYNYNIIMCSFTYL